MKICRTNFFGIQKLMDSIPFNQAKGWNDFLGGKDANIDYFVDDEKSPSIAVWGRVFKIPIIGGKILKIEGESFNGTPSVKLLQNFYNEIFQEGYSVVLLSSLTSPSAEYEIGIRKAGYVRPLGFSSCPLSILVNITDPEKRHRAWKKNYRKAVLSNLVFKVIDRPTDIECHEFCDLYEKMKTLKGIDGHYINEDKIKILLSHSEYNMCLVRTYDDKLLSARIFYLKNNLSYGIIAANSEQGRQCGSSYYMSEMLFEYLKDKNVLYFDFGRIGPGLGTANSVSDFKIYSGGRPILYSGEWIRSKSKYVELLFYIYKAFVKNSARY